ncbi:MAG TPA: hypothetical protein VFS43_37250 [Polyangiaceae bacterium]|nr:hypothetical protein [Polyangiaceae bacterium]
MAKPRSLALLASLASLTTLAIACASEFQIAPDDYCNDINGADSANCAGGSGTGGRSGSGGGGGDGGGSMGAGGGVMGAGGGGGGGGGTMPCEGTAVDCGDGKCTDIAANDANNCGACGHGCAGLACEGGVCASQAVVTGEVAPYALVQDETSLYWASPAKHEGGDIPRVRGVRKDNAGQTVARDVIKAADVRSSSLAIDGAKLFWGTLANSPSDTQNQRLASGFIDTSTPTPLKEPEANIQRVVFHGGKIYWTADDVGGVRGIAADGSSDTLDPDIKGEGNPRWLTIDADNQLYWISETDGAIRRQSDVTPPLEDVVTGGQFVSVELSADRVYWARRNPETIVSAPKDDPANTDKQTLEFSGQGRIEGFTLKREGDLATLFVVTFHEGSLNVWRKQPGEPAPLRLGRVTPVNTAFMGNPFGAAYVLVDGAFVYFIDVGTLGSPINQVLTSKKDGIIYRVAK